MTDLSVLIPARHEEWLGRTIDDMLTNARGSIEIIAVLDGEWPTEPLQDDPRVALVKTGASIGQRAATNLAAKLARGRYVMKVDAHVSMAEGYDVELVKTGDELGHDVTQIPAQRNLHVYSWVCRCGWSQYQGAQPTVCGTCGQSDTLERQIVWKPRPGTTTTAWTFDAEPKFSYAVDRKRERQRRRDQGDVTDTMTSLGACFVMRRERFFELGGLDESYGSWGSFGIEIACKSWLSGGSHVCNHRTWFAHLFRTGKIGFPYPISGSQQEAARERARQIWFNDAWPQQVRPLSWLLDRFWPVAGWDTPEAAKTLERVRESGRAFLAKRQQPAPVIPLVPAARPSTSTTGAIYYSDCRGDAQILEVCRDQLVKAAGGRDIVSVTLQPVNLGRNLVLPLERGYLTMFRQILAGLEAIETDIVCFAEHDVLYAPSNFEVTPPRDRILYNQHVWKVDAETGRALHYLCSQTSGLCAYRDVLLAHYRKRVEIVERQGFSRRMGFEPGTRQTRHGGVDDLQHDVWMARVPNVDIRTGFNLTPSRWKKEQFRNQKYTAGWTEADAVPGWPGQTRGRFREWLADVARTSRREWLAQTG